jgi:hypothetical protein
MPSDDNAIFLGLCHKLIGPLLKVLHRRAFHRISSVVRPAGFFLTARIYTTSPSSAIS